MSIDLSKRPSTADSTTEPDSLLVELQRLKGRHSYIEMAREIGLYEGMLRAYMTDRSDAGIETLSAIVAWDLSADDVDLDRLLTHVPKLTGLVLLKMIARGNRTREREQQRDDKRSAA